MLVITTNQITVTNGRRKYYICVDTKHNIIRSLFLFDFFNVALAFGLAGVEVDEFVERLGLWVGVVEHPEQVFEEDNLACDIDGVVLVVGVVAGPLHEFPEDGVVEDAGGDTVEAAGLADVDGVEIRSGGGLVVGDGAGAVAALPAVAE